MAQPATVTIRGDASQFVNELSRVRGETARTATAITRDLGGAVRTLGAIVGTGFLANFVRSSAQTADQLAKTADRLGVTTEALQALRLAARGAGADVAILDKALAESQKRLAQAAITGQGDAADWLKRLNLNARELQQLSPDQLFKRYADSISELSTRGEQFAAIQALMGKGTEELLNLIDGGSGAIQQAKKDIEDLGIALTRVDARQIENANDALERARAVSEGLGQRLAVAFAPFIESFANGLVDSAKKQEDLNGKIATFARGVYFAFNIAANAAKVFDVAISGVVVIVSELEERFLGAFKNIALGAANLAERAQLTGLAEGLRTSATAIGNVEGFFAAASERAQERVDNALAGIKSFEQIGIEADRIVAEAKRRAEEEIANRPKGTGELVVPTEPGKDDLDIEKYVEQQMKLAQAREDVWTEFDKKFEERRVEALINLAEREARIVQDAEEFKLRMREQAADNAISILQVFGQKNKAFALAALIFEKALAIQKILISTKIAAAAALTPPPIGLGPVAGIALAAKITAAGYLGAASVAALGVAQAVNLFSEGGNAPGSPTNPIFTQPTGSTSEPQEERGSTVIHFHGWANEENRRELIDMLREIDNRDIIVFDGRNANAQVIREGG